MTPHSRGAPANVGVGYFQSDAINAEFASGTTARYRFLKVNTLPDTNLEDLNMKLRKTFLALAALVATLPAMAATVVLDFEGIAAPGSNAPIGNFYAGQGVTFSANALAINGYNGSNEPTPTSVMFFLEGNAATLTYASGFDTGFSFFYSSSTTAGLITVYDGVSATGNVLATFSLAQQANTNCPQNSTGYYCNWTPIGVAFNGIAKSIDFAGSANYIGFDDVTFGSVTPGVPEPETYALMLAGLGVLGFVTRRRKAA